MSRRVTGAVLVLSRLTILLGRLMGLSLVLIAVAMVVNRPAVVEDAQGGLAGDCPLARCAVGRRVGSSIGAREVHGADAVAFPQPSQALL